MLVSNKSYYRAVSEFLRGDGVVYTEFIGEVATRQISVFEGNHYSSSSVTDWHEDIGYLLYDGKKNELDLSDSEEITDENFETEWKKTLVNEDQIAYIHYHSGDASIPFKESVIILHVVNNLGKWGKGFVLSLSKRYPLAKEKYLASSRIGYKMGDVQFIEVDTLNRVFVANMVAQEGIKKSQRDAKRYISYEALEECLEIASDYALCNRLEVQMPMIGAGLGGGDWQVIIDIIKDKLTYKKIPCHILTLD
ncbi:macro domain-containing protein [Pantoea sp. BS_8]|uniref:Appr-1-p processing protein n=1 Tax=Pantoea sp. BS_8 TaxID=3055781 RepID=UPI0035BF1CE2